MSYICKGKDGNIYDLKLLYIQRAYLPAITVCNQSLFKQTFVPTAPLPSVTNFVLESNGLVTSFSWTPNATYTTYADYKIDSGEWISLDDYAVNSDHSFFNFTEIATIGQSIYIRLRFGNGTNYGAWNEEYVVTTPFVLFYGNTLPTLQFFIDALTYSTEPTLSLSGNNVIIDHPEYVTEFESYETYDGRFDFTACSNVTQIYAINNNGIDVYGCGNLTQIYNNGNTSEFDIDFTGCTSLGTTIVLQSCNITNLDFMDTIPNKSILLSIGFAFNDITTVDLTDFPNLLSFFAAGNANLSSFTLNSSVIEALGVNDTPLTSLDLTDFTNLFNLNVSDCSNLSSLILNSSALREIYASNTALTSLDLSSSLTYNIINIGSSNISTLTIANGTANEGATKSYYDLSNNDLSIASLNAFFTALGAGNTFKKNKKQVAPFINVQNNPGAELCDPTIATAKGWSVYTGFSLGTGISLTQQGSTLVFDFAWTQNANYSTYSQYKINSGGIWTNIDTYAPNYMPVEYFDASSYMTVGDTFYLRLRFGDGVDYGSWDESSITTA